MPHADLMHAHNQLSEQVTALVVGCRMHLFLKIHVQIWVYWMPQAGGGGDACVRLTFWMAAPVFRHDAPAFVVSLQTKSS